VRQADRFSIDSLALTVPPGFAAIYDEGDTRIYVKWLVTCETMCSAHRTGLSVALSIGMNAATNTFTFLRDQATRQTDTMNWEPHRADDATRIALVALSWLSDWRRILIVVTPDTLIRWHRKGFRLFWRWKPLPGCRGCRPTCSA
jgi:hypothetical protein